MSVPSISPADVDHCLQNIVPGLRIHHNAVREHAAVPADVSEAFDRAVFISEPKSGVFGNIELAIGILGETVPSGFVMSSGTEHGSVVLSDVKINRPGTESVGQCFISGVESFGVVPGEIVGDNSDRKSVV